MSVEFIHQATYRFLAAAKKFSKLHKPNQWLATPPMSTPILKSLIKDIKVHVEDLQLTPAGDSLNG